MPFTKAIGAVFSRYAKEEVTARLDWAPELCTAGGLLHGGAVMSLADSTGAACAFLNLPEGAGHDDGRVEDELPPRCARWLRRSGITPLAHRAHGHRRRDRRPRPAGPPRRPGASRPSSSSAPDPGHAYPAARARTSAPRSNAVTAASGSRSGNVDRQPAAPVPTEESTSSSISTRRTRRTLAPVDTPQRHPATRRHPEHQRVDTLAALGEAQGRAVRGRRLGHHPRPRPVDGLAVRREPLAQSPQGRLLRFGHRPVGTRPHPDQ